MATKTVVEDDGTVKGFNDWVKGKFAVCLHCTFRMCRARRSPFEFSFAKACHEGILVFYSVICCFN